MSPAGPTARDATPLAPGAVEADDRPVTVQGSSGGQAGAAADAAPADPTPFLFDPDAPTARPTDPGTSRDYGRGDPGRNPGCARVLVVLAVMPGGGCASEIAAAIRHRYGTASERSVIARRITDLRARGLVTEDGTTRTPPETRRRQLVHYITPEGRGEVAGALRLLEMERAS